MKQVSLIVSIFALAGAVAAASAQASAQTYFCPTNQSIFGTVQRTYGRNVVVSTRKGRWATVRIMNGARVLTNGYALHPGSNLAAYGCVTRAGIFDATQVSVNGDAAAYRMSISGTVRSVGPNRLLVAEPAWRTVGYWYVPDAYAFRPGESVYGVGMRAASGVFYPQTVNGMNVAYQAVGRSAGSVTLRGQIRRVLPGRIVVWEPNRRTNGTWYVRNAGAFRVGEYVVGTGTESRYGNFYPWTIH